MVGFANALRDSVDNEFEKPNRGKREDALQNGEHDAGDRPARGDGPDEPKGPSQPQHVAHLRSLPVFGQDLPPVQALFFATTIDKREC